VNIRLVEGRSRILIFNIHSICFVRETGIYNLIQIVLRSLYLYLQSGVSIYIDQLAGIIFSTSIWSVIYCLCKSVCFFDFVKTNLFSTYSIYFFTLHSRTRFGARRRRLQRVSYLIFRIFNPTTGCKHLSKHVGKMRFSH
jgi:hypothetical protein